MKVTACRNSRDTSTCSGVRSRKKRWRQRTGQIGHPVGPVHPRAAHLARLIADVGGQDGGVQASVQEGHGQRIRLLAAGAGHGPQGHPSARARGAQSLLELGGQPQDGVRLAHEPGGADHQALDQRLPNGRVLVRSGQQLAGRQAVPPAEFAGGLQRRIARGHRQHVARPLAYALAQRCSTARVCGPGCSSMAPARSTRAWPRRAASSRRACGARCRASPGMLASMAVAGSSTSINPLAASMAAGAVGTVAPHAGQHQSSRPGAVAGRQRPQQHGRRGTVAIDVRSGG